MQNYPNPFNLSTIIEYILPNFNSIRLVVYDLLGRHVKNLLNSQQPAGHYQITWDGTDDQCLPVVAGVYFCRMEARNPSTVSAGSLQASSSNNSIQPRQSFVNVMKLALMK